MTLIEKLQVAKNGSAELDGSIYRTYIKSDIDWNLPENRDAWWPCEVTFCKLYKVPPYTTSFAAALTLVPKGWRCSLDIPGEEGGRNHVTVVKYSKILDAVNKKVTSEEITKLWNHSYAATPILALCIATLKCNSNN